MFHQINNFAIHINKLIGGIKEYKILLCVVFACQPMIGFFFAYYLYNCIKKAHIYCELFIYSDDINSIALILPKF